MTIQRGIDPRGFALLSFGGAGPAQSPAVMELLGMKACIVPPIPAISPPSGSSPSTGAPIRSSPRSCTRTRPTSLRSRRSTTGWSGCRRDLIATASILAHPHRARSRRALRRAIDGGAGGGAVGHDRSARSSTALIDAFHAAHLRTFGYNYAGAQKSSCQFLRLRLRMIERPRFQARHGGRDPAQAAGRSTSRAFRDTPIYDRAVAAAGFRLDGRRSSRSSAPPPWSFPASTRRRSRGILIVRGTRDAGRHAR
jgi:N-methylhydantoinase A